MWPEPACIKPCSITACSDFCIQVEYVEGVEKHNQETHTTIERERITSATVKQLKAEIKEEKAKHEEQVHHYLLHGLSSLPLSCTHAAENIHPQLLVRALALDE